MPKLLFTIYATVGAGAAAKAMAIAHGLVMEDSDGLLKWGVAATVCLLAMLLMGWAYDETKK